MVQQFEIKLDVVKDSLVGGGNAGNVVGIGIVCSGPASSIPSFKNLSRRYLDNSEPQDYGSSIYYILYYYIFIIYYMPLVFKPFLVVLFPRITPSSLSKFCHFMQL